MARLNLDFSTRFFRKGHYTVLLIALLLNLFVLPPLEQGVPRLSLLLRVGLAFVFFGACYAIAGDRRAFRASLLLAVLAYAADWIGGFSAHPFLIGLANGLAVTFFLWIAMLLLRDVLGEAPATLDKLFGAICIYLLVGLVWAELYSLIHQVDPGAFNISDSLQMELARSSQGKIRSVFLYYSFITLTTLGYGDISPVSLAARSMAALEAVVGPLYLAILVARLVSVVDITRKQPDS